MLFSVIQSCLNLCHPVGCSTPGFRVLQYLPELAQTHVRWVDDAIQPSHHIECRLVGVVRYVAFSHWLLSLSNMCLSFFHIFLWLDCSFFVLKIFFHWSTVDLQCCVSFWHTAKWYTHMCIYIYSVSHTFPLRLIIRYWIYVPVLYKRTLLSVCFVYSSLYPLILKA